MSINKRKPKLTSKQIVEKLKNEKGVTFNYVTEEEAETYLSSVNNYMRTASYRKNYTKIQGGKNTGKYESLDFGYLKELSTIDMYLRFIVSKMCLDIEHALKVKLIYDIENDDKSDGYDVVTSFLDANAKIIRSLENKSRSPFTGDLINKYFTVEEIWDNQSHKMKKTITDYSYCPIWVLVEILSYGEFISFYSHCYGDNAPIKKNLLHIVRSLRNGTAHNNCMLADLRRNSSNAPAEIKEAVKKIDGISKTQRMKNLSTRPTLEFTTMLYVYGKVVSEKVAYHHSMELRDLFKGRMKEKSSFFMGNDLICNTYKFACKMIDNLLIY